MDSKADLGLIDYVGSGVIRGANRLADLVTGVDPTEVLNSGAPKSGREPAHQALKRAANAMRIEALNAETGTVDYASLATSEAYRHFRDLTHTLPLCTPEDLGGRHHRLAFWINLYNSLILDAVIHYGIEGSLLSDRGFFRRAAYDVCGLRFSADDIEHGILRGNQPHPLTRLRALGPGDPRLKVAIQPPDPRIHFALVCGARSCPPIASYDGDEIDDQLDRAAASFINNGGLRLEPDGSTLYVSKLLDWYRVDFDGREGVLAMLRRYASDPQVQAALARDDLKIRFLEYDWSVNAAA